MSQPDSRPLEKAGLSLQGIGRVSKSNGTDGEVVLTLSVDPEDIDLTEPVFIDFDGLPVPFFIESSSLRGRRKLLVHLTDIRSFDDAEELVGREVSVDAAVDDSDPFEENDFSLLVGWTLVDADASAPAQGDSKCGAVGVISDFVDIPGNPCLEIQTKKETVMIPFHEDLIVSADPENRTLVMDIPEGLY